MGVVSRKVGGACGRAWVIPFHLSSSTTPSSRCWERNDVKAIWWIIRTPILMTILVCPAPPSPGGPQGSPILGSEGSTLYPLGRDGAGSTSVSPHRLISSSLSAFLAFFYPS